MRILNNKIGIKFVFVLFLFILLQIPVTMIKELISEREERQQQVQQDIAKSSSDAQYIIGPFISVSYNESGNGFIKEAQRFILPDTFHLNSQLDTFEKYRGIYKARLYRAQTALTGQFDLSPLAKLSKHRINKINIAVGIADSRGLIGFDELTLGGKGIKVKPGTGLKYAFHHGFQSELSIHELDTSKPLSFDFNFLLQGMGMLKVAPIGKHTTIGLSSSWLHPSFVGDYLPVSSDISDEGFKAVWKSNNFSTDITQRFNNCMLNKEAAGCSTLVNSAMGVNLIDPVDHYLKSYRAVNYSLLVITLIFAGFFLLELFQASPIHPVQYGFVGLALALFYLLLTSFSEHMGFNWAYFVSAFASVGLLSVYVSGILDNVRHGIVFGGSLLILYSLLFGLLQAENYALLMGSLLCFVVLNLVMVLTRKVNWYKQSGIVMSTQSGKHTDSDIPSDQDLEEK